MRIRKIKPADYEACIKIIHRTHRCCFSKVYPKELIEEWCEKYTLDKFAKRAKEMDLYVCEAHDIIVGIIGLKNCEIRTFFVDPDAQGKGAGRALYNYVEEIARERGCKCLTVEGGLLGEPVYKKFGFTKIETIHKERKGIKYTDALMKKEIENN